MNVKVHTPASLKKSGRIASAKQFLLSLVATTISILLTFGTAAIIDGHKKKAAKKEMVKMLIYDFDKTIEQLQHIDTVLKESSRLEQEIAVHPEYFDSLRYKFIPAMVLGTTDFSKTTEKIFSSNIETFSTIGNANFIDEVSTFYMTRDNYKTMLIDTLKKDLNGQKLLQSPKDLLEISFPEHYFTNWIFLNDLKKIRNECAQMMNISEEDMEKFSQQFIQDETKTDEDPRMMEMLEENDRAMEAIQQARAQYSE